ncbi:hypothetical protein chiPu_0022029 [Chiloscyllium punctatum]|uniref:RING-type domain-containing protein n=1 Tax=Chiloscyllium punctatum TaxID=137246 RepID=A0A401RHY3_CHIPU|nr:hypothetical protein [Chiloscyllium punctatum]
MASDGGKGVQRGSELTDNLSTDLSCPICIDYFREPVSLRCGHNFCRECILHAWAWSEHANGSVSCPQCRRQCDRLDVASNRLLARIVEGFQRLCHPDPASPPPSRCQLHQQGLGLFCSDDLQLVCRVCVKSQQHRNHKCTAIGKAYKVCKGTLPSSCPSCARESRDPAHITYGPWAQMAPWVWRPRSTELPVRQRGSATLPEAPSYGADSLETPNCPLTKGRGNGG